jgi:hypothetical protein
MGIRSGDIRQFTIQGREFDPAPSANVTLVLSGLTNENQPTGNGQMHTAQRRKLGGFDGMTLSVDTSKQDYEFIQGIADTGESVPVTLTLADSRTYSGDLVVEGDLQHNAGDGTLELAMRGKTFEQI